MNVEQQLQEALDRVTPDVGVPDWGDVLGRAARRSSVARRRVATAAAAVAAAIVVAAATPLGAAIARGVGDFSAWLTGQPGESVTGEEQQAFDAVQARSWLGFPKGTQLRRLATTEAAGTKVELLGFRSGETMCLRIVATGKATGSEQSCAPLRELRTGGAPARALIVDQGFGRGSKQDWYGPFRARSSLVQVTAGIVADGIKAIELTDEAGRHSVPVVSNSFLYVAGEPDIGQRVRAIAAESSTTVIPIPFAQAASMFGGGGGGGAPAAAPGPAKVDRVVSNGSIGWLERREPRGESIDIVPERSRRVITKNMAFGRVLAPSAERPLRVALTLNTSKGGSRDPSGICTWLLTGGGAGGGCSPRDEIFKHGPVTVSISLEGGSDGFLTAAGFVSDDVRRLAVFLTGGEEHELKVVDNTFAAVIARSKLPGRIAAYDADGKVIGLTDPIGDVGGRGAGPALGRATSLLKAESPQGSTAELLVGPSTTGGECMYIHYKGETATGTMTSCADPDWTRYPVMLNTYGNPGEFVMGRVRPDLTRVEIGYADGAKTSLTPTRGYVLYEIPAQQIELGKEAVTATGFDPNGKLVATWSFKPPKEP